MRNTTRIKALENQVEALKRQKGELKQARIESLHALEEIQAIHTAVMISVTRVYGKDNKDGTFTIEIPRVDVQKNVTEYTVKAGIKGVNRTITIIPKENEDDKQSATIKQY